MMYLMLVVSFLLDGILSNFLPYMNQSLSLFTPYFSVSFLFLMVPFFRKDEEKKYYLIAILYGFFYDVFYTNLLMCHVILFVFVAFMSKKIWKNMQLNFITIPFFIALIIGIYHASFLLLLSLFNIVNPSIQSFLYLWSHSILLNIIYGEILYLILNKLNKKYHRLRS